MGEKLIGQLIPNPQEIAQISLNYFSKRNE
jgi:hypothetical protein